MTADTGFRCLPVGDRALLAEFDNRIGPDIHRQVLSLAQSIEQHVLKGALEVVTGYRTVLVHYDPLLTDFTSLATAMETLGVASDTQAPTGRHWQVPVLYGGKDAPDLERVARRSGLAPDKVIQVHSGAAYRVYLVGFAPGWTFLGGLDQRLHTPRLETPRAEVPAGCVSIGGQQTLIGGPSMPSGWNLVGRTPERTFAPEREESFFIAAGDRVSFRPIEPAEFEHLSRQAEKGERVSREVDDERA